MINQPPILITGCARSGTSMVAALINICGAFGGNMSGPNRNNKKGMFENAYIRNHIIKPYLMKMGLDALGQYPLPDIKNLKPYDNLRQEIEKVITNEGYKSGPWFYKGAKMCLIWPTINNAFPDAKWIIVRRRKEDIVASCLRTPFMRAFRNKQFQKAVNVNSELEGWSWWVDQHIQRFFEMQCKKLDVRFIWPEKMLLGDFSEIRNIIDWLGLTWNKREVNNFIDVNLWNGSASANRCPICHNEYKKDDKGNLLIPLKCSDSCDTIERQ